MPDWKVITRKAVVDFRDRGMSVIPIHRNAIHQGYKLIGVGGGAIISIDIKDQVLVKLLRTWLYEKRNTRTIQRSEAALWMVTSDDKKEILFGLGQMISPSHPVVERWARKGGLFA